MVASMFAPYPGVTPATVSQAAQGDMMRVSQASLAGTASIATVIRMMLPVRALQRREPNL